MNKAEKQRAKEINLMPIENIEALSHMLTPDQLNKWSGSGYCGETYVKLTRL